MSRTQYGVRSAATTPASTPKPPPEASIASSDWQVVWVEISTAQHESLPPDSRRQVDDRIHQLQHDPARGSAYDPSTGFWLTDYGDGAGLLTYLLLPAGQRIMILRIVAYL